MEWVELAGSKLSIMSYSRTVPPRAPTKYQRRARDDSTELSDESPAATPPVQRGATQQSASHNRFVRCNQHLTTGFYCIHHSSGFHVISPDPSKHAKLREGVCAS